MLGNNAPDLWVFRRKAPNFWVFKQKALDLWVFKQKALDVLVFKQTLRDFYPKAPRMTPAKSLKVTFSQELAEQQSNDTRKIA